MEKREVLNKVVSGLVTHDRDSAELSRAVLRNLAQLNQVYTPPVKKGEVASDLAVLELFGDNKLHRMIAEVAYRYYRQVGDTLSGDVLAQVLEKKRVPDDERTQALFLFEELSKQSISRGQFDFWLDEIVDQARSIQVAEGVTNAIKALEVGYTDPKSKVIYKGSSGAMEILDKVRAEYRLANGDPTTTRMGDIRHEVDEIREEIDQAKLGILPPGTLFTGIRFIDDATGGFRPGSILIYGAAPGHGKTQMAINTGWFASCVGKLNGLILTLETSRTEYRRRFYARHSNAHGVGRIGGIPYQNIKMGQFADAAEEQLFWEVCDDFATNPQYGVLDIAQGHAGMNAIQVFDIAEDFQQRHGVPLHYLVIDYTTLLGPIRTRGSTREEMNENFRTIKALSVGFDNGRGIVCISPHQMTRDSRKEVSADAGNFYTMADLSDTSEVEKIADAVVAIYRDDELREQHELAAMFLKCRDSEAPAQVTRLYENYGSSFIGNLEE